MSTTEDSIEKKIEDLAKMLIYEGAKSARTDKYPKKALAKALSELSLLMEEEYRKGWNDNARDCNCDVFPVHPHHHLLTDGESHNIRPDIVRESK